VTVGLVAFAAVVEVWILKPTNGATRDNSVGRQIVDERIISHRLAPRIATLKLEAPAEIVPVLSD
jgi:hypothetical protein